MKKREDRAVVLIVDDVPDNIDVLKNILKDDYRLRVATNGEKALHIINDPKKSPDIVLLDVMMPGMDGYEVLKKMKESAHSKDIPVIFVTAKGELSSEERGFTLGAVDYITKPVIPSLVEMRVANQISLLQARKKIEYLASQFSRYLSPSVSKSLTDGSNSAHIGSKSKLLTVFFSDIVSFTARTEQIEPNDLTKCLNSYLDTMAKITMKYGGTLDKYIGDAVMVFFGDPETKGETEDAYACIEMALEMNEAITHLAHEWGNFGGSPFSVRMGIATGYCTVGNFGSESKMDYTIIGNTVNLASRMESQSEPGEITVDEACFELVKERYQTESKGLITAKGFANKVNAYSIKGKR